MVLLQYSWKLKQRAEDDFKLRRCDVKTSTVPRSAKHTPRGISRKKRLFVAPDDMHSVYNDRWDTVVRRNAYSTSLD